MYALPSSKLKTPVFKLTEEAKTEDPYQVEAQKMTEIYKEAQAPVRNAGNVGPIDSMMKAIRCLSLFPSSCEGPAFHRTFSKIQVQDQSDLLFRKRTRKEQEDAL